MKKISLLTHCEQENYDENICLCSSETSKIIILPIPLNMYVLYIGEG